MREMELRKNSAQRAKALIAGAIEISQSAVMKEPVIRRDPGILGGIPV